MSIRQDVFGLETVYRLQVEGLWSAKSDVWLSPSPFFQSWDYGYFGGGTSGLSLESTVDRVDYSNDTATASPKGPLSAARYRLAATGNSSFGYFGGGNSTPIFSTVDRIDYTNDNATALVKGPLSLARYYFAATGNSSYGYFGGGQTPSTTAAVSRIDYSNDTSTASPKGPLSLARYFSSNR
jgi:hypothetical protein